MKGVFLRCLLYVAAFPGAIKTFSLTKNSYLQTISLIQYSSYTRRPNSWLNFYAPSVRETTTRETINWSEETPEIRIFRVDDRQSWADCMLCHPEDWAGHGWNSLVCIAFFGRWKWKSQNLPSVEVWRWWICVSKVCICLDRYIEEVDVIQPNLLTDCAILCVRDCNLFFKEHTIKENMAILELISNKLLAVN